MCEQRQAWDGGSLSKLALALSRAPGVQHVGRRKQEQEVRAPHKRVEVEEVGHMWEQVGGAPHRQVEAETHRQEVEEGALPQLGEVEAPHRLGLAVVHKLEVGVPHILVVAEASHTQAPHAPQEGVHRLAEVVVVGVEHSGGEDGSDPCAWCGQCGRP